MARRRRTTAQRVALFKAHAGRCHLCGGKIDVGQAWQLDHVVALELSGDDSDANLAPAHKLCHAAKTRADDVPAIAQAKRREAAYLGAKAPPKRTIRSAPLPAGQPRHPATAPLAKPLPPRRPLFVPAS